MINQLDTELQSPLKEQQNKNQMKMNHSIHLKNISSTEPMNSQVIKDEQIRQSLNLDKENSNSGYKRNSIIQIDNQDINHESYKKYQNSSSSQNYIHSQESTNTPHSHISYKILQSNKSQLEKIQENDDEKVLSSIQRTNTQQSSSDRNEIKNQNKTLKQLDGQIKDLLNTNRFKDLSNLLELSKNQLKNDVQEIINGLENDQQLINSKINDLQEEYNEMKLRKSENQEVDETRFKQIENNLQKQINYLQSLRSGLVQSQHKMYNPFIKQQTNVKSDKSESNNNNKQNIQQRNEQTKSHFYKDQDINNNDQQQNKIKDQIKSNDLKSINKTENINKIKGDGTSSIHIDSNSNNIYNNNIRQPNRLKTPTLIAKNDKNKLTTLDQKIDTSFQNDQQLPDLYRKNREQSANRKEVRKIIENEESRPNYQKITDIDLQKKIAIPRQNKVQELKQIEIETTSSNSRSKKCLSAMRQYEPKQDESNKEMLLKRLNNRKDFSSTIRGIFHSDSKNMLKNSPDNSSLSNNQSIQVFDQDKLKLKNNKISQKLDLNEIKILPRDPVRKRTNNYSFVEQRNTQNRNKTPDTSSTDISRLKRLDQSYNQFTPHKETNSGNYTNHSHSISHQNHYHSNNPIKQFLPQQSDSSILKNISKSQNKYSQQNINNLNSSKDSLNMSQILSKASQNTNRVKRGGNFYRNGNVDPFDQTQNSYLHNESQWKSKIDYMDQIKHKYNLKSSPENWRRIANDQDIDNDIKIEQLKQYSQMLGLKAKRKIQLSRVKSKNNQNQFFLNEDLMEADDLIINSIKAKLAIIETVNKQYDQQISEQGESLEQSVQNLDVSSIQFKKK